MIRVCLADDQALVRAGVRALLEASGDVEVVAEAEDGEEAVTAARAYVPDVLVLDVRMPRLGGIGALQALARAGISIPAILLTTFDDDEAMIDGIRAGARAFVLKDVELAALLQAIRIVAGGGSCLAGVPSARLLQALQSRPASADDMIPERLTERERQVLALMSAGLANRDIGAALAVSEGTVKNHVSVILAKLGVADRTKAVLRALGLGLI